jgi:glycosyltransferase involved in cell wall biosynthesis
MRVLFLHQNMPGQFKHLAPQLAADPANRVVFATAREGVKMPRVQKVWYKPPEEKIPSHPYLRRSETAIRYGQQVARACLQLRKTGFTPDLVIAHTGWGESLFVKDVFPETKLLGYCEFYYHARGADSDFLTLQTPTLDSICRTRIRNSHLLLGLEACDRAISPTEWQKRQHPRELQAKISVIFDGIDTARLRPDPSATFELPGRKRLTAADEVVTFVSRTLEPYRGFPEFMRALPHILRRRPLAHVLIVGGDGNGYFGDPPPGGGTWREKMLAEVEIDPQRVHFLGRIPYDRYRALLQVSTAHVYLTVPFVLSWSMVEAMSSGCLIIGSATPPVQELIQHGRNGILVDFFDSFALADAVVDALDNRDKTLHLRAAARQTVLERYELRSCLRQQMRLIGDLTESGRPTASTAAFSS